MSPDDQDILSAYIDNELSANDRVTIQKRLLSEPELNKHYQQLLVLQSHIKDAYPTPDEENYPEGLASLLSVDKKQARGKKALWLLPIAASVAAIFVMSNQLLNESKLFPSSWDKIAQNLDAVQDMDITAVDEKLSLVVLQSFTHTDGRLCKEYQSKDNSHITHAVACKQANGWNQEVVTQVELGLQQYQTASKTPDDVKSFLNAFKKEQ